MEMTVETLAVRAVTTTRGPMAQQAIIHLKTILPTDVNLNRTFLNSRKPVIKTKTANEGNLEVDKEAKACLGLSSKPMLHRPTVWYSIILRQRKTRIMLRMGSNLIRINRVVQVSEEQWQVRSQTLLQRIRTMEKQAYLSSYHQVPHLWGHRVVKVETTTQIPDQTPPIIFYPRKETPLQLSPRLPPQILRNNLNKTNSPTKAKFLPRLQPKQLKLY